MLLRAAGRTDGAKDHTDVYALIRAGLARLVQPDYDPAPIVARMRGWEHEIEVNPGPCFVLPEVLEAFGPDLAVIHLIRQREPFIESCIKHIHAGPERWGNFAKTDCRFELYRPTAVHFGEMTQAGWDAATLQDRVAWLYDVHKRETERHLPSFRRTLTVRTEALNSTEEQRRIADFLDLSGGNAAMPWFGWTKDLNLEGIEPAAADHLQRLLQYFDWNRATNEPSYPFVHFVKAEVAMFKRDPGDPGRRQNLRAARHLIDQALAGNPAESGED